MFEKFIYFYKMLGNILSLNIFDIVKSVSVYNMKMYFFFLNYINSKFLCIFEFLSNELFIKLI